MEPASAASHPATPTPAALIGQLIDDQDRAPLALIDACAAHGDAMVAPLRDAIDGEAPWAARSAGEWWLLLHAAFILGRIPSAAAGALLVHLMRRMDAEGDDDLQGWLAGGWPALFANKPRSAVDAVREPAADDACGRYIRHAALEVLLDAALREGEAGLEAAIDYVAARVSDESENWDLRTICAMTLLDFPRERHRSTLAIIAEGEEQRSEQRGGLGRAFGAEDIEHAIGLGQDTPGWQRLGDPWKFYDPAAIQARQQRWREEAAHSAAQAAQFEPAATYVRTVHKVGRNEPCPCGSGSKYKRCCLVKDEAAIHALLAQR